MAPRRNRILSPGGHAGAQTDRSSVFGKLYGIGEQVVDDLIQSSLVSGDGLGNLIYFCRQTNLFLSGFIPDAGEALFEQPLQLNFRRFQFKLARLDFGQVENIVHQREQMPAAAVDIGEIFFLGFIQIPENFPQN